MAKKNDSDALAILHFKIYKDILNGYNRQRILKKLKDDGYGMAFKTSTYSENNQCKLYKAAKAMLKLDGDEMEQMRDVFFQRYEHLYQTAMEANDRTNALATLNAMNKMMGLTTDKVSIENKSIVEVKFGFGDGDEEGGE